MSDLNGKVALITGAAHGQGRATALALAREGVHIVALDVARQLDYPGYALGTPDNLESLVQECQAIGVTEPQDIADAVVYLSSDRARFITGSQFVLDAGLLSR